MNGRRVVITGAGVVSPIGSSLQTFWSSCIAGRSGIRKIEQIPEIDLYPSRIGGEVTDFDPDLYMSGSEKRKMDPFTRFGIGAAVCAVEDSGLDMDRETAERVGVIIGSGIGGLQIHEEMVKVFYEKGPSRFKPMMIPQMITDMLSGRVAIRYNCKGPNFSISSACGSGAHAIGECFRMVQYGDADVMITGGAEAAITRTGLGGFCVLRAVSTRNDEPEKASRPFDAERDGFVISEGAGVLVLEELEHARKRGAKIYAEIAGYGRNSDAFHITAPDESGSGGAACMRMAMKDAGIAAEEVGYINAHGTSTPLNDVQETKAIKLALGEENAGKVPVSSLKSMTGHPLGAAGAMEAVASILTLQEGIIPPTINYENPDPECDLDYVPNEAREKRVQTVLSNSFGFGGHNATLCFRRF